MENIESLAVIGVDGGGTSCRFAYRDDHRRVEYRGGRANMSSDPEAAIATLRDGLDALAQATGIGKEHILSIPTYMGLAGITGPEMSEALKRDLPVRHLQVEDDRRTALIGALEGADGCVAGIGTGAFYGRRTAGRDHLIGGWGFVLGDEASGAWLGRQALRQVLQVQDGIVSNASLTADLLKTYGDAAGIVAFAGTASPADFAQIAPRVIGAAGCGDPVALGLMREGAQHIEHSLASLGWQKAEALCLIGGVAPHYAPYLAPTLADSLVDPRGTALDGALHLAGLIERTGADE